MAGPSPQTGSPVARGSVWRKWDLHTHTPASWDWKGGPKFLRMSQADRATTADQCLDALEKTDVSVFATQDHCTFDGYRILKERIAARPGAFSKLLLPGVELHLEAPTNHYLDYHIIFSPTLPVDRLEGFLQQLKMLGGKAFTRYDLISFAKSMDGGKKKQFGIEDNRSPSEEDYLEAAQQCARVTRESVDAALSALPRNTAIVMLPYSTSGGFHNLDWKRHPHEDLVYLRRARIFEARGDKDIALFRGDVTDDNRHFISDFLEAIQGPKACVAGTDAHEVSKYGMYPSGKITWIRADPTFEGLLHAVLQPRERIFIGQMPDKLAAQAQYPSRFIDSIEVRAAAAAALPPGEKWFDLALPLNPGLTAIIGNKGSGKSALADILALLGNARCRDFSFLHRDRFRKAPDRSQHFEATIRWLDQTNRTSLLSGEVDATAPERVRYLPQARIEALCNEIVTEGRDAKFEEELRAVVFAHVPPDERLGAANLDELIDKRSAGITAEIEELRTTTGALNKQIADLEARTAGESIARVSAVVEQRELELAALDRAKPALVAPPSATGDPLAQAAIDEVNAAQAALTTATDALTVANAKRAGLVTKQVAGRSLLDRLGAFEQTVARVEKEMAADLLTVGLHVEDVLTAKVKKDRLLQLQSTIGTELDALDLEIGAADSSGLMKAVIDARGRVTVAKAKLDAPMRQHQASLAAIAEWQMKRDALVGSSELPDTLEHARAQLKYLREGAQAALAAARSERDMKARAIVRAIDRHAAIKRDLYRPVHTFLEGNTLERQRLNLEFTVTTSVNRFAPDFLPLLNQGRSGSFMGTEEGRKVLDDMMAKHAFDSEADTMAFVEEILDALATDKRDGGARVLTTQLRRDRTPEDLYNLLFKFDWLRPHYALQLDGKPIPLLSPGEKGALLIVFYLLLDPSTVPLIIDQPEHNLDNESIWQLLVPCFREAARRRQVVVITHNPNLAVVADADQVVHARIDREDGHRILYTSGGLESPGISRLAVDVLEGTLPAFKQRGEVYELVIS